MKLFGAASALAILVWSMPVSAQPLPDSLRQAGVTRAQWDAVQTEVRRLARDADVSAAALSAVADRLGIAFVRGGRLEVSALLTELDASAQRLASLESELAVLRSADDPAIAALLSDAVEAINAGDLDRGATLLRQASESDLAAATLLEAQRDSRLSRAAQTIGVEGGLAEVAGRFREAAALYARAAEVAPESDADLRLGARRAQAGALSRQGVAFNDTPALRDAEAIYEALIARLTPTGDRERWGAAHALRGFVQIELAQRGEPGAVERAIASLNLALTVISREQEPGIWAAAQEGLARAYNELAERGDDESLERAIILYEAAVAVIDRVSDPMRWAESQNNLAGAYGLRGMRSDPAYLRRAIAIFEEVLTVNTLETNPEGWVIANVNRSAMLWQLSLRGDANALDLAIASMESVLQVLPREQRPVLWANVQANLGLLLQRKGELARDVAILQSSVAAFEEQLSIDTRDSNPPGWGAAHMNMGYTLLRMAENGDATALPRARAAFDAALTVFSLETSPSYWAMSQMGLGNVGSEEAKGAADLASKWAALERAIAAYRAALSYQAQSGDLNNLSLTNYNLALALMEYSRLGHPQQLGEAEAAAMAARDGFLAVGNQQGADSASQVLGIVQMLAGLMPMLPEGSIIELNSGPSDIPAPDGTMEGAQEWIDQFMEQMEREREREREPMPEE